MLFVAPREEWQGTPVVDTLGILMSVAVHEASTHDSVGVDIVMDRMKGRFPARN